MERIQMPEKLEERPEYAEPQALRVQRPKRAKLTAEESLRRMESLPERVEEIVAAVRKSKNRDLST